MRCLRRGILKRSQARSARGETTGLEKNTRPEVLRTKIRFGSRYAIIDARRVLHTIDDERRTAWVVRRRCSWSTMSPWS
jgi:hypothetical protein